MWHLLFDFLLLSLGMGMGILLMCLLQVGKEADERIVEMKRRDEE